VAKAVRGLFEIISIVYPASYIVISIPIHIHGLSDGALMGWSGVMLDRFVLGPEDTQG
jgi:hypothetical protein